MDKQAVAAWFLRERGITADTLRAFNVTMQGENVVFTYPNGQKDRPDPTKELSEGQRRFYFTRGESPLLFQHPSPPAGDTAFLCEGESDTMRLWQELAGAYPVFGLGGVGCWNSACAARLSSYARVFVCLDNDPTDYGQTGATDLAWRQIRHDLGAGAKRVVLPRSVKDVCQFFLDGYELSDFKGLTERSATSLYAPVDFLAKPAPVNWCLQGVFARGDVNVLSGVGGLGKSMLTMGLTAAIVQQKDEFLGFPLWSEGKVLYVDEENPLDIIHSRLRRLGFDPPHIPLVCATCGTKRSGSTTIQSGFWMRHSRTDPTCSSLILCPACIQRTRTPTRK